MVLRRHSGCLLKGRPNTAAARLLWRRLLWLLGLSARSLLSFRLTGGTGKFAGIRGTLHAVATTDFKNVSDSLAEGEYWMEPTAEATGTSTPSAK